MAPEIETNQALMRIVKALEAIAESLAPIGNFFATMDVMLEEFPNDAEKITPAALIRGYQRTSEELQAEDGGGDEGG